MTSGRMRIGAVAGQAGVNIQTLRYYERRGLLETPERTPSGYREYPSGTVRLVRFIKRAQGLGFTLDEVAELLLLRERRAGERSRVLAVARVKLDDIDQKIRRLQSMKRALGSLVQSCACKGSSLHCPILEALDDDGSSDGLMKPGTRGGSDATR